MFGLKHFLLSETRLRMGIFVGSMAALLEFLLLTISCAFIGLSLGNMALGAFVGALIGLAAAPAVGYIVFRHGKMTIRPNYRGIPTWFSARMDDPQYEMKEGDHWVFKFFGVMGSHITEVYTKEKTETLENIPIEVKNGNRIPTTVVVQWKPQSGELVHFDNVDDIVKAFRAEATQAARTFGMAHEDLDDLVHEKYAEHLAPIILEALQRRARGEIVELDILVDATCHDVVHYFCKLPNVPDAEPWGLRIESVSVSDFALPDEISTAADQIDEAERNVQTSKKLTQGIVDNMDALIERGVNPTAAMGESHAVLMPDRAQSMMTHNVVGFEPLVRTIMEGVLVMMGKGPLPTPTKTKAPRKKTTGKRV